MFIDTHSHLYDQQFADDIDDVLQRAFDAGAAKIFLPNINSDTVVPMIGLATKYPGRLYPMLGLHPEDLQGPWRQMLVAMERLLASSSHPFIGIGEIGLDYYWDRSMYKEQQEAFAIQVGWAMKYNLPLMIHTRDAHREMVDVLKKCIHPQPSLFGRLKSLLGIKTEEGKCVKSKLRGVFHCFGGTAEEAEELLNFDGFMLGIGGVVTYKKSPLPAVLREIVPLQRIVIETDSPYLAPVPYRGKRNETAYIVEVIRKLADIYSVETEEVEAITTENALKTFPKAR